MYVIETIIGRESFDNAVIFTFERAEGAELWHFIVKSSQFTSRTATNLSSLRLSESKTNNTAKSYRNSRMKSIDYKFYS